MCHTGTYSDMMYTITQAVDEDPTHEESEISESEISDEFSVGEDTSSAHNNGKVSTVTILWFSIDLYNPYIPCIQKWSLTRR